jgi:hypothetical protein
MHIRCKQKGTYQEALDRDYGLFSYELGEFVGIFDRVSGLLQKFVQVHFIHKVQNVVFDTGTADERMRGTEVSGCTSWLSLALSYSYLG